jgi:hypothetical protein
MPCIPLIPLIPPAIFAVAPLLPLGFPLTLLPASMAGWTEAPAMAMLAADIDEALLGCRSSALLWMLMGALPKVGMPLPVPLARSCASAPMIVLAVTSVFLWRASASVRARLIADPWNLGKSPILQPSVAVGMLRGGTVELSWLLHLPPKGETGANFPECDVPRPGCVRTRFLLVAQTGGCLRAAVPGQIGNNDARWKDVDSDGDTHFRRRLSCTTHSTLSHLQLPQGAPSTTSQRTLRARQLFKETP